MKAMICMDIGGTTLKAGLYTKKDGFLYQTKLHIDKSSVNSLMKNIKEVVNRLQEIAKEKEIVLSKIALGIAGLIEKDGLIRRSPNIRCIDGINIKSLLKNELELPVEVENDANIAALGEFTFGAGKASRVLYCITLGTGIGGGLIIDGEIFHGSKGLASELGHMIIDPNGPLCNCGNRGCLEAFSSGTAIVRMAKEANIDTERKLTPLRVYNLAKQGNIKAKKIFEEIGYYLGIGLTNLIHLINPDTIVIAGGVVEAWDLFSPSMLKAFQKHAFRAAIEGIKVKPGELKQMAGLWGAAAMLNKN